MPQISGTTITNTYYSAKASPLDAKQTPADVYLDIASGMTRIPRAQRYVGLTVTVLNKDTTNIPVDYWLVGGTTNANWKVKAGNIVGTKANLLAISPSACTVGLEMVVQADETNDGKVTKYWVTEINGANVTWERKVYGGGTATVPVEGEDQEQNA
jgi:hypothetical protein